jgi:hypothetical protein
MNWKYEFIDITLILTLNYDILVTLNDLILASTILVSRLVHHVSSRRRTIAKYMLVSLYIRARQNAQVKKPTDEVLIYINESFFF